AVAPRVGVVHPVDLGALEDRLRTDLQGALGRRGVGGEERRTEAGAEDDDPALLQVADGAAGDVGLRDLAHVDRGLHPRLDAPALQEVLQREAVDDGAEHAHVVGAAPLDAAGGQLGAAHHVAAADHDRDLDALLDRLRDGLGDVLDDARVDTELLSAGERLAGELQYDTVPPGIVHLRHVRGALALVLRHGARPPSGSPEWYGAGAPVDRVPALIHRRCRGSVLPGTSIMSKSSGLADLEADDALHGHPGLVHDLLHGLLVLLDDRLPEQRRLLEEPVDPALDDLGQGLLRLALLAGGGLGDLALLGDDVRGDLVLAHVLRRERGDLLGEVL